VTGFDMTTRLLASLAKEVRLIVRDREALLMLFLMPLVFVLIMSLALQATLNERAGIKLPVVVVNEDDGAIGKYLVDYFASSRQFQTQVHTTPPPSLEEDLRKGRVRFAILVPKQATVRAARRVQQQINAAPVKGKPEASVEIGFLSDPTVRADQRALMVASLNRALQAVETTILLKQVDEAGKRLVRAREMFPEIPLVRAPAALETFVEIGQGAQSGPPMPSSTQQHVPAWTLLAMFFLVVPLSVTFIKERDQGSLLRLRSLAVSPWLLISGKMAPYFIINQLQMALLMFAGVYVLPLLGGEALEMGNSPLGIALVSSGASIAAIGYGFLISSFARTTEQATVFGPVSVLILAGIGGVLVPKMVMPPVMQQVSLVSPFSWALEGFFDVFLRDGGVREVAPETLALVLFGIVCFGLAALRFHRQFRA
jgi:ABC-2 type transport system permease protein